MAAPTRRTILGAAAALPLAAVPAAAAAAVVAVTGGPDAELLRLAAEFQRNNDRYQELTIPYFEWVGRFPEGVDEEVSAIVPANHDLAEQIAELHATTLPGLRAKARVLLSYSSHYADGSPEWANHDELMGWSIARDLAGDEAAFPETMQARFRHLVPAGKVS